MTKLIEKYTNQNFSIFTLQDKTSSSDSLFDLMVHSQLNLSSDKEKKVPNKDKDL